MLKKFASIMFLIGLRFGELVMGSIQKNPGKTLFCLVKIEKVKGCSSIHQKVTRTAWLYEHVVLR